MRISDKEKNLIVNAALNCFGTGTVVWLFGSRADDQKNGGDIDIYIETDESSELVARRIRFKSGLHDQMGEQKIDVVVHQRKMPLQPIHEIARSTGIQLN